MTGTGVKFLHNGGLRLFIAVISTGVAVVLAVAGAVSWASGRLQTPEQKIRMIRSEIAPYIIEIEHISMANAHLEDEVARLGALLKEHANTQGHSVLTERVRAMIAKWDQLDALGGHPVLTARVDRLEATYSAVLTAEVEETELLRRIVEVLEGGD